MIKAVFFDLDGVLCDLCEVHRLCLNQALYEVIGYQINEFDHKLIYNGLPTKEKLNILHKKGIVSPMDFDKIFSIKQDLTQETIKKNIKENPEKIKMLSYLKEKGLLIGCVTNSVAITSRNALDSAGYLPYMDIVVSNEDTALRKPNPDQYELALKQLNISDSEAIAVEDSKYGIEAAKRASIRVMEVSGPEEVTIENIKQFVGGIY